MLCVWHAMSFSCPQQLKHSQAVCTCMITTPSDVIYYFHYDHTNNENKMACKTCFKAHTVICNLRLHAKTAHRFCETSPEIAEPAQLNPGSHPGTSRAHRKTTPVVTSHFILTTSPFSLGQNRKWFRHKSLGPR